jgi:hypothetical protein
MPRMAATTIMPRQTRVNFWYLPVWSVAGTTVKTIM